MRRLRRSEAKETNEESRFLGAFMNYLKLKTSIVGIFSFLFCSFDSLVKRLDDRILRCPSTIYIIIPPGWRVV